MTTRASRFQPIHAWAVVDRKGVLADLPDYFALYDSWDDVSAVMARLEPKRAAKYHVEPVTVRAWAPPQEEKGMRDEEDLSRVPGSTLRARTGSPRKPQRGEP